MTVCDNERILKYIENVRSVLKQLRYVDIDENTRKIIKLSELYLRDAEYYLGKNDFFTSLACISYAEGLLASLKKKICPGWIISKAPPTITLFLLHLISLLGHSKETLPENLRESSKLGRVIVIVARDKTIMKNKNRHPIVPEEQRLKVIKSIKYVDEAYLGSEDFDILETIEKYKPDIIFLGPDQDFLYKKISDIVNKMKLDIKVEKLSSRIDVCGYSSTSKIISKILEMFG